MIKAFARVGVRHAAMVIAMAMHAHPAAAQGTRPRATLVPREAEVTVSAGSTATLALRVDLPKDVHVQAHEPKDALLIPTVLTVEAPEGVTVKAIRYPAPTEFHQTGRAEALLVLGPVFEIAVQVSVAPGAVPGMRSVPVVLRYQACNDSVCFPPARATAAWTLTVRP